MRTRLLPAVFVVVAGLVAVSCGGGDSSSPPEQTAGSSGNAPDGSTGDASDASKGGSGGDASPKDVNTDKGGNAGTGGASGTGGVAGTGGGTAGAGTGGTAGAGTGGTAGAGTGGTAGAGTGGTAGAGTGGTAGAGTGGTAGAGTGGAAGTGGGTWNPACSNCHGSAANPAPPKDMLGNMDTASPGVGSHQSHIAPATWHHQVECTECHIVPTLPAFDPTVPTHMNGNRDIVWGPLAQQGTFDGTALTCTGSYCHGGTLVADVSGKTSNRIPTWNTVDGSQKACGANCHTLPPGGTHPAADGCPSCHGAVIATFDPANPQNATWADASLHINGIKEVASLNCTSCHGDTATANPAPPRGTNGEMATTDPAVGAHERHLTASGWHRSGQCSDCHATPGTMTHSNGAVDFAWGTVSTAQGATPAFTAGLTCTGAYCHGTTLMAANTGGTINRIPVWNQVDGTWAACGTTCHTNPPGGTHVANTGCPTCHNAVIATYDPTTKAATWTNAQLHINGTVEVSQYHDLTNWVAPKTDANHHGGHYFVQNQQRDEHNLPCTQCHGADYNGGTSGVSCNNPTCHGGKDWKSCSFCHGTAPTQNNPPNGVAGETANTTLAVGRHVPHLTASTTHVAFACGTCHAVPAAGDVAHALQYVPSADLTTAGHHGDVAFVAPATGMVWNVAGVAGNPVNARGTCLGSCHSNGRGGPPLVTPYWAGGAWTVGSCTSCHANSLNNLPLRHSTHNGEATCTDCHPPASGSTHLNGTWDVKSPISAAGGTGSVTTAPPGGVCGVNWSCNGTCHGKNHNNLCWN